MRGSSPFPVFMQYFRGTPVTALVRVERRPRELEDLLRYDQITVTVVLRWAEKETGFPFKAERLVCTLHTVATGCN